MSGAATASSVLTSRSAQDWLYAIGRLRPGASPESVSAGATVALRQWFDAHLSPPRAEL